MKNARIAGAILIAISLGFVAVFSYLAKSFGYPEILAGTAAEVLPAFAAGGQRMRVVWTVYALLPLGIAVSAIFVFPLFRQQGETSARLGMIAAIVAAAAMTVGLARWPTLNYALAQRFIDADAPQQQTLATVFDTANLLLGRVIGEFLGEVSLSLWFLTLSIAIVRGVGTWRWPGYLGLFTAASMTVGAFRNLSHAVDAVATLNNSLLPIWLIILGVTLMAAASIDRARVQRT